MEPLRKWCLAFAWAAASQLTLAATPRAAADEGTPLREVATTDAAERVVIELTARGQLEPQAPPGGPTPKPVDIRVQTRFDFTQRPLRLDASGRPLAAARKVHQAAAAINSADRPMGPALRPGVALLVAELRESTGAVVTFSPGGPLTRPELDLVQTAGDPLVLGRLLPEKPVAVGDTWPIGPEAARALSDYETIAANSLKAKLEALDEATARIKLAGEVRGSVRGGAGTVTCDGTLTFNRRTSRIERLELDRREKRKPGLVEAGLDFQGKLTVSRNPVPVPPELGDEALRDVPTTATDPLLLVLFQAPDQRYSLLHDRAWHLFWDDTRMAILRRVEGDSLVAQCNLSVGPNAGPGRHQDPEQFRADIRKALGERFVQFLGAGELDPNEPGGYLYKVSVQGRSGDRAVLWHYYLVAGPRGDQLLLTFTLDPATAPRLADQDTAMAGSVQFAGGR